MIKGIGIDLAKISRFENKDQKFVKKILTEAELKQYSELEDERKTEYLAGRFAAKEAYYKAMKNNKLGYHNVEIIDDYFSGPQISDKSAHISISHDGEYVVVVVIVEK
jgi:holo-[acyl-carrier protein] synthase